MASQEGQQIDTLPIQMYGWDGSKPVRLGLDSLNPGFTLPKYDTIETDSETRPTSVVYKNGGVTVATLTITYSGGGVSIVRTYA